MKNIKAWIALPIIALAGLVACKKNSKDTSVTSVDQTTTITAQKDPALASSEGFFIDDWQPKTFLKPGTTTNVSKPSGNAAVNVTVDYSNVITKVPVSVYGNNTNPFMGQFVTEPVLLKYINDLAPRFLRFPGGGLSDIYFWNGTPGNPPADAPHQLLDAGGNAGTAGYWFGNNTESWTFTLDNYYKALNQTHSKGIITINYGYARYGTSAHPDRVAAHLAADWVRYDKGRTRYWEIGNENFGTFETGYWIDQSLNKDGQPAKLTGALYGLHFKVFADSMRKAALEVGAEIKIGAVLTETAASASNAIPGWNAGVIAGAGSTADFYIVHNYYTPYNANVSASAILATPQPVTSSIMQFVTSQVTGAGAKQLPIAFDEWNIQAMGGTQNTSNIAGIHAAMTEGEIIKNKFGQASRWDLANGWSSGDDQGMFNNPFNKDNEPDADRWNPRPAFYYMYFFQQFFGDRMVASTVEGSADIFSYASSFTSGEAGVILVNRSKTATRVNVKISNFAAGTSYYFYTLNGGTDNGDFSRKVYVNGVGPAGASGGPANYLTVPAGLAPIDGGINVTVPAYGAVFLVADKK
ncbi:alpha-L-arabinofuranosidase [Mucilaginibacter sp.]|uniref:alpha-L-arabinofuranosidase n=1 Tax=Mucilaginibacter sp. TaxID=1882438 RepID=UPI0025DC7FBD|nr:alpha-L-arabinofuranosidase [Mucilaginibacter sp.]